MDWVLLRNQWSQKYVSAVNGKPMQAKLSKGQGIINTSCIMEPWYSVTTFVMIVSVSYQAFCDSITEQKQYFRIIQHKENGYATGFVQEGFKKI